MAINSRYEVTSSSDHNPRVADDPSILLNAQNFFATFTTSILKSLAKTFCVTASKYSPPGNHGKKLGTTNIDPQYYYCPIVDMKRAAKDHYAVMRKEDYAKLRQGFQFKIIRNKYREKPKTIGYAKSMRTAKQMARITNRGLLKYSWGSIVNNFSGSAIRHAKQTADYSLERKLNVYETKLPPTFRLLAQKSPNIAKYTWGDIKTTAIDMAKGMWRIKLTNYANYAGEIQPAIRRGTRAIVDQWRRMIIALNSGQIDTFDKYLTAELKRIEIKNK